MVAITLEEKNNKNTNTLNNHRPHHHLTPKDDSVETVVATAGHTMMTGDFPPCTADKCLVEDADKKAASARGVRPSCEMTEKCVNACADYGRVCPCAARIASHAACDAIQELQVDSKIFGPGKPDFNYFNAQDLQIGRKLGEGGFSYVNECTVTTTAHQPVEDDDDNNHNELAIKYLKRQAMVDLHHFKHGAADLAVEAYFLQTLNHPNIVKIHGITAGSVETNVATGKECGFFILIDRLNGTLESKIDHWRFEHRKQEAVTTFISRRSAEYKDARRTELLERCHIALSIARAMEYLHSLNVVYRDLKPDNIGFDNKGVLKLFDFGLAKELKHAKENGTYKLTGHTGSRRYMAPEVAQDLDYNLSVDVYSFGILLWEICSAEKPFYGYSSNKHLQQVVVGGERPKMDSAHTQYWPNTLQNLMKKCWSTQAHQRPTFSEIIAILEQKICCLELKQSSGSDTSLEEMTNNHNPTSSLTSGEEDGVVASSPRFFPNIFPVCHRNMRSKSTDAALLPSSSSSPPPHPLPTSPMGAADFKALKPSNTTMNNTRARTWGFAGTRR